MSATTATKRIKWIFCDMDGTLLDSGGRLPPDFDEVVDEVGRRGATFIPASGRQYAALTQQMGSHQRDFMWVAENGTYVVGRDGEELFAHTLTAEQATRVLDVGARVERSYPVVCTKRLAYVTEEWRPHLDEMRKFFTQCAVVDDLYAVARNEEVIKVAFCDCEFANADERLYPPLEQLKGDGKLQVVLGSNFWVDVFDARASKGNAIRRLQTMRGVSPEQCAAFGDYLNDYEMFKAVGHSVAMANAHPELAAIACGSTESNDERGVTRQLRRWLDDGTI